MDSLNTNSATTEDGQDVARQLSAVKIQQLYYEMIGDADWELYEKKERKYLIQKIARALIGPPTEEGNLDENDELKLQGYALRDSESVMNVFNKISEKAKFSHNGENILISTLRVVCVTPKQEVPLLAPTPDNYWVDLHTKTGDTVHFYIFHVFSIRKCISMKAGGKCCKIYIDHDGRVYQNWDSYMTQNKLPKCVMVVPSDGVYKGDLQGTSSMPVVRLTVAPSPALGLGARVLSITDTASTVASIGGLVALVGAFAVPAIAPVALPTAIGIGAATGIYGIVRSSMQLADRKEHEQDIDLRSSEARGYWINIIVSTAGLSLGAATKLLSWAAASGTNVKVENKQISPPDVKRLTIAYEYLLHRECLSRVATPAPQLMQQLHRSLLYLTHSQILMNAVTILQYTNIGSSAVGVANSLGEMIHKYHRYNETPSGVEIFQFTTAALFLGLGVMSNQTAQDIVRDAQANTINEMRDSLSSNTKRRMFDKVTAETRRIEGTIKGNSDVIKALKNIKNKDDFFAKIARMNKDVNKNKIRVSLSPDGNPVFNNKIKVDLSEFYNLGKQGRNQLFSKYGPADVTTKNAPTRIYASNVSATSSSNTQDKEFSCYIRPEVIINISKLLYELSQMDQEYVAELLSTISASAHEAFLLLCAEVIDSFLTKEITLLSSYTTRDFRMYVIIFIFRYLKSLVSECNYDKDHSLIIILKEFIRDGCIKPKTILDIKKKLFESLENNEFNRDLYIYDDIHSFRRANCKEFMSLRANAIINVDHHKIIVKAATIDKLDEWLKNYSQNECDIFMELCFKIIRLLSTKDIDELNLINPDEDIIMRVSYYLIKVTPIGFLLEEEFSDIDGSVDRAMHLMGELLKWRSAQKVRKHKECTNCKGICFSME